MDVAVVDDDADVDADVDIDDDADDDADVGILDDGVCC